MTTGEGGVIVTNDLAYSRVLRSMSNQGRDDDGTWMNHVRLGYNYRLDEMSAALGLSQLQRLDTIIARRAQVASWYNERLGDIDCVQVPYVAPETTRMSWFVYVVRLDENIDRDRIMAELEKNGIPARPYFVPIHVQPLYRLKVSAPSAGFSHNRANRPNHPGAAVLHRHAGGEGRLRVRATLGVHYRIWT